MWHVFVVTNLNITKISDVSTGFYYWNEGEIWALWYGTCEYNPLALHIAIYNGEETESPSNVTT